MTPTPNFDTGCTEHVTIVLSGDLDLASAEEVTARLLVGDAHPAVVIADLSGVTFMDCRGVGALIKAQSELRTTGRSLCLARPSAPARRLLDLCGLSGAVQES